MIKWHTPCVIDSNRGGAPFRAVRYDPFSLPCRFRSKATACALEIMTLVSFLFALIRKFAVRLLFFISKSVCVSGSGLLFPY